MTHKQDKNGNIDGYIKKEHHDKMMKNSDIKINKLQGDLENLKFSSEKVDTNFNIFKVEYKKKCEDYNRLVLKLEGKGIKRDIFYELEDKKKQLKCYIEKYGEINT